MAHDSSPWSAHRKMEAVDGLGRARAIPTDVRADLGRLWAAVWEGQQDDMLLWSVSTHGPHHTVEGTSSPALALIDAWREMAGLFPFHMDDALRLMDTAHPDGVTVVPAEAVERTVGVRANLRWFLDEDRRGTLLMVLRRVP